jgi:hypothetical protein
VRGFFVAADRSTAESASASPNHVVSYGELLANPSLPIGAIHPRAVAKPQNSSVICAFPLAPVRSIVGGAGQEKISICVRFSFGQPLVNRFVPALETSRPRPRLWPSFAQVGFFADALGVRADY